MSPKIINVLAVLVLGVLAAAILSNSMAKPLGRDEQMYCTGGVLIAQGKMVYRDFSYVAQMPYHALLYAVLFKALDTTHYLLVGRIVSSLCDILVMVLIVGIFRHVFGSPGVCGTLLGLAAAALYVFNPLVDYANGYAWNNDVVILCVLFSLWLYLSGDSDRKSNYRRLAVIGALLTLASCMRGTTALVQLLFFVVLLTKPAESSTKRLRVILPLLVSTAIVLIWPVWLILQARRAFFINVFRIHMLNSEWLHKIGMVHNKLDLTLACLTTPGYFVLIVLTVYFCLVVACLRRRLEISSGRKLVLGVSVSLMFFIIAEILPTLWRQHLAAPVPFLVLSFAYPLLYLRRLPGKAGANKHFKVASILLGVCVIVAVASYPVVLSRTPILLTPENWEPMRLHKISEDIAKKTKEPKLILTLGPLFALEGGCDIYTELSAGPFAYRIADFMSSDDRTITHTVGPQTLAALVDKSPPSAVVLGIEPEFIEASLFRTAVRPQSAQWETEIYEKGLRVYFRR